MLLQLQFILFYFLCVECFACNFLVVFPRGGGQEHPAYTHTFPSLCGTPGSFLHKVKWEDKDKKAM